MKSQILRRLMTAFCGETQSGLLCFMSGYLKRMVQNRKLRFPMAIILAGEKRIMND